MGFRKSKVAQNVTVSFTVRVESEFGVDDGINVSHVLRRPSIKERELYRQMAHSFQGGKPQLRLTKANLKLWDACIVSVSGYDDLPEGDFKAYFLQDDLGREHADAAVRIMLEKITETEADLEKNSDE